MKPLPETPAPPSAELLRAVAEGSEVTMSASQADLLAEHARMVIEANTRMNLTRITEPEEVARAHVLDSLLFLRHVEPLEGRVLDLGSGAGYPGIPLAISGYDVALCEARKKKAAFLEACVHALGLHVDVHALRAEELAMMSPGMADVVVARAVSRLAALVELAAPLLVVGGRLVALKGRPDPGEVEEAERACRLTGMEAVSSAEYALPGGAERSVYVYRRTGNPRVPLPRRTGLAQRHPLGSVTDYRA